MHTDYETLTQKLNFRRLLKISLLTLLISIAVLAPALWYWEQSIQMRSEFRSAKNVLLNTELLSIQYSGLEEPLLDSSRESGMSKEAEEEVKSYSGVEGEIHLISWDKAKCRVLSMTYQEGKYLVIYEADDKDSGTWTIYRKTRQYENQ